MLIILSVEDITIEQIWHQ